MTTKYALARSLREASVPDALADYVASRYGELKNANETLERDTTKLRSCCQETLDQLAANVHIHDWVTTYAADVTRALANRERAINDVKAACHLLAELGFAGLAVGVRVAAFGSDR